MMQAQLEVVLVAVVTSIACAIAGVFLVLRRMALMSDAISHAILLGIVIGFFIGGDLGSPLLIVGAALIGVVTVGLTETINRTGLVKEDAAIGLVFPLLFSIGVILISRIGSDVHLDTDAVLLGEIAFAPFRRLQLAGLDLGPKSLAIMSAILLLNAVFIMAFFKELKLSTFDPSLAATLGFAPWLIQFPLMGIVSITAVGAFDAVGSILVVALMIAPAAGAYLLTDRLSTMIWIAAAIAALSAIGGYWMADLLDVSIAGSMAAACGVIFALIYLFAPNRGLFSAIRRRARQRLEYAVRMLLIHLKNHENQPESDYERSLMHLENHFRWEPGFARRVVGQAVDFGFITAEADDLSLTPSGRKAVEELNFQLK